MSLTKENLSVCQLLLLPVDKDLLEAVRLPEACWALKQSHLHAAAPSTQFHGKMSNKKLGMLSKKSRSQGHGKEVVLKGDRKLAR